MQSTVASIHPASLQTEILRLLQKAESEEKFLRGSLDLLRSILNATAVLLLAKGTGPLLQERQVSQSYPLPEKENWMAELTKLSLTGKEEHAKVTTWIGSTGKMFHLILTRPIFPYNSHIAVILELKAGTDIAPFFLIVQWMASVLPLYTYQKKCEEKENSLQQASALLELLDTALHKKKRTQSLRALLLKLAEHLGCEEVALGQISGKQARLLALSKVDKIERRIPFAHAVEESMMEAARGKMPLYYPQPLSEKTVQIDLSQQRLVELTLAKAAYNLPYLDENGDVVLVWTFLWKEEPNFEKTRIFLGAAISLLSAFVERLRFSEGGWGKSFWQNLPKAFRKGQILLAVIFLGFVAYLLCQNISHTVYATGKLSPLVRRMASAPFEAVLKESYAKTGDFVKGGQTLALLEGKEMRLELAGLEAEYKKALKERDSALAEHKVAASQMAKWKAEKCALRMRVLQDRLKELEIRAPMDGIVLSEDLKHLEGVTVSLGQPLFEIASLSSLLLEIHIAPMDISYIAVGQKGEILLEGVSEQSFAFSLQSVKPISEREENRQVFVCEATLSNPEQRLRPGMQGKIKIEAGVRPVWWVYFHKPWEWLQLQWF